MRVCPTCRTKYGGGEVFCPVDASRLVTSSAVDHRPVDPNDHLVGAVLAGRYEVKRVIGEGGMGLVYEARHRDIDKSVAIKVLRQDMSTRPDVVARFRQEAKSASRIGHENIVDVSDFGETPFGSSYFVMEYLQGEDLAQVLGRETFIEPARACRVVMQCCRALGAAHAKQIVHRDMKPENVFLIERGDNPEFVKIVDFGIAKISDLETHGEPGRKLTKTGMIFGTPEYMSPEQAAGKSLDHRVDIYALGVILFECLAGRVPFEGDTFMGVLTQHMFADVPEIRDVNPRVRLSDALEQVILKALAKNPDDRYQTADELAEALELAQQGRLSRATVQTLVTGVLVHGQYSDERRTDVTPPRSSRGSRWVWVGLAAACALLAVAAGFATSADERVVGSEPIEAAPGSVANDSGFDDARPESRAAPSEPAATETAAVAEEPLDVQIRVATAPSGARVLRGDGTLLCSASPCSFETSPGTSITLLAKLGSRTGRTRITPAEDQTVRIALKEPRRSPAKPARGPAAVPRAGRDSPSGGSDLKVPEWAR